MYRVREDRYQQRIALAPEVVSHLVISILCLPFDAIAGVAVYGLHYFLILLYYIFGHWEAPKISKLASSPEGKEIESTALDQRKPGVKSWPLCSIGGKGCEASAGAPLSAKIQRSDVRRLETEPEGMEPMVTPAAKKSKSTEQEEGGKPEGPAGRRVASLRRCSWWWLFIYFLNIEQCGAAGGALLQGVCQLREGDEMRFAGEFAEVSPERGQGEPEGAAEETKQAKEPACQDQQQAKGSRAGQGEMDLVDRIRERRDTVAERQARGKPEEVIQRVGGPAGGAETLEQQRGGDDRDHRGSGHRGDIGHYDFKGRRRGDEQEIRGNAGGDGTEIPAANRGGAKKDATALLGAIHTAGTCQYGSLYARNDRGGIRRGSGSSGGCSWYSAWSGGVGAKPGSPIWGTESSETTQSCFVSLWREEGQGSPEEGISEEDHGPDHGVEVERHGTIDNVSGCDAHDTQTCGNGAVMHSWHECETREHQYSTLDAVLDWVIEHEKFCIFVLMMVGDALVFVATFLYLAIQPEGNGKNTFMVAKHRYFCRRRRKTTKYRKKGVFLLVLICQQHAVQGDILVEKSWSDDSRPFPTDTQFQGGASGVFERDHWTTFMTRPERLSDLSEMPMPSMRDNQRIDGPRSEGGDFSMDQDSDGDHYQMAYIFQLGHPPISKRLMWDVYWPMHRQIAAACGVSIDELVGVHHVRHQPLDLEEMELQSVIAQKSHEFQQGDGTVLVLTDLERHHQRVDGPIRTQREVRHIRKFITRKGILELLGAEGECEDQERPCLVWWNNRIWKQQHKGVKEMQHGDYVRCAIPDRPDDECQSEADTGDELCMVQMSVATQTVDQIQDGEGTGDIEIHGLGSDLILLEDATQDIRNIAVQLESVWDIPQEEVETLHEVKDPPIHRQRNNVGVYLLEMRGDSQSKGCPDDVMIFSEVIVRGRDNNPGRMGRVMVLWMRRRARRLQALSQLRLDGFCDREEVFECKIFYNNILWPEADYALRQFLDGDAIWVEITMNEGPASQAFAMIEDIEAHVRSLQLYGRRPAQQPDEEPDSYTTAGSDCRGRSRSRQRMIQGEACEAPGSVEDAPWDLAPHPTGSIEGISLLQVMARCVDRATQGRRRWSFSSLTRLAPPGNPDEDKTVIDVEDDEVDIGDGRGTAYFHLSDEDGEDEPREIDCGITTTIDTGQLWKMFQPWCEQAISMTIDIDDCFSALSLQYLSGCGVGWDEAIDEIHIFTDGSFHRQHDIASYAMAIFGWSSQCQLKHHFLGWTGGLVTTDETSKSFVGAKAQSAADGEVSALIWALMWTLQTTHWRRVHYHFDAMTAGYTANGTWRLDENNLHKRRLREVAQAVEAVRPNMIMFHHEKAHSGQPANELVDGFAKQIIRRGEKTKEWQPDWRPMFQQSDKMLTWAWWFFKGLSREGGLPKLEANGYRWKKQLQCGMEGIKPLENKELKAPTYSRFGIRFATYNAMTLRDKETEQGQRGEDWKAALLRRQFSEHGIHIVGLQETRAGSNGVFNTPDYVRFVSGGHEGHHGCELWVHKGLKIGVREDKPVCINAGLCTILHADPRTLVASISIETTKLIIYVLHVPHDGTDETKRLEWWQEFEQLVQRFRNAGTAVFLGDLNARFGEPVQGRVGCRTCSSTSKNAHSFLDVLESVDGWLPSTFSDYHSGQDWTWTHPRGGGRTARLDYIAVEKAPCLIPLESWVEKDINTSLTVRDHESVILDVELQCGSGKSKVDKPRYDWDKLTTEDGKKIFQELVKEIPDPHWSVDVHVHWQHIENALHQNLAEHFPPPRKQSRRDLFTKDTLGALNQRKFAKKILDQADEEIGRLELQSGFYAWRDFMHISAATERGEVGQNWYQG